MNRASIGILVLVMMALSMTFLLGTPLHIDEAWICDLPYNWVKHGIYGSPMFTGYLEFEKLNLSQPLLFTAAMALCYKLFGFGLVQSRLISVAFSGFLVLLTYLTARRLYNAKIGLISAGLLMCNPLIFRYSRIARPEIMLTALGLLSVYLLIVSIESGRRTGYFLCGIASGAAFLTHYNGIVLVLSIFAMLLLEKDWKHVPWYMLGCILMGAVFLSHILQDYALFRVQFFDSLAKSKTTFSLSTILQSILGEQKRYFAKVEVILPSALGLGSLIYLGFSHREPHRRLIRLTLLMLVVFGSVVQSKTIKYACLIYPMLSIVTAAALIQLWKYKGLRMLALLTLIVQVSFIGDALYKNGLADYNGFSERIQRLIPPGAVVVGEFDFWFPLAQQCEYRASRAVYEIMKREHRSFEETLAGVDAEYLIFDEHWRYECEHRKGAFGIAYGEEVLRYIARCELVGEVEDRIYGHRTRDLRKALLVTQIFGLPPIRGRSNVNTDGTDAADDHR